MKAKNMRIHLFHLQDLVLIKYITKFSLNFDYFGNDQCYLKVYGLKICDLILTKNYY